MIVFYVVEFYVTQKRYGIYVSHTVDQTWQHMTQPNECILLAPPPVGPRMWDTE